jgi:hypothetical protein
VGVTPANQGSHWAIWATRQPKCSRCIICRSSPFGLLVQSGSIIVFLIFASCAFSFLYARLARSHSFRFSLLLASIKMRFSTLVSAAAFFELSIAGYVLEDDYMTDFFSKFNFFTGADPTEG